ncbi:MAG: LL-diaminopimelate aminotransferase [Candidatus Algichlamydia australiensis]|nr:LL-diaminopimelate aminotransferase [Chlamydiales bacterium]
MGCINQFLANSKKRYIFPLIEEKIDSLRSPYPLIDLSVGDIKYPLSKKVVKALQEAASEMGSKAIGYGPSCGYDFLREAIQKKEYPQFTPSEIFISDGINRDLCCLPDLFAENASVFVFDPTYPVHADTHLMAGKKVYRQNWQNLTPPQERFDLLYLCSPANPTGIAMNRDQLQAFVDYAVAKKSYIIFDAAYAAFAHSENVPKSIYELPGAEKVAIELKSFSKSHGFTGLRCSYTVIPKALGPYRDLWQMREETKSNGVSYPIQKAALAALNEPTDAVTIYLENAKRLRASLQKMGLQIFGGVDSPYLFVQNPPGKTSWEFFEHLAAEYGIVTIPGCGFGESGEGFVRFSTFAKEEDMKEVCKRLERVSCATK